MIREIVVLGEEGLSPVIFSVYEISMKGHSRHMRNDARTHMNSQHYLMS